MKSRFMGVAYALMVGAAIPFAGAYGRREMSDRFAPGAARKDFDAIASAKAKREKKNAKRLMNARANHGDAP
ncbi:MAG: hypothetical protein E6Q97_00725 [Desulfurellales bacterium]|nr:MAG: hypothetical protein E6Q97_00725 [Desulfurellales bacterium]